MVRCHAKPVAQGSSSFGLDCMTLNPFQKPFSLALQLPRIINYDCHQCSYHARSLERPGRLVGLRENVQEELDLLEFSAWSIETTLNKTLPVIFRAKKQNK